MTNRSPFAKKLATEQVEPITEEKKEVVSSNKSLINDQLQKLLEEQVEHELFASRLYLYFSMWCRNNNLVNTATLFYKHSLEEQKHANSFINELSKLNFHVKIPGTKEPDIDIESLESLIDETLKHEYFITEKISTIRYEADKTSPIVLPVANAYLQEQTEELQLFNSLKSWFIICKDDMPTFEDTVLNLYNRESHIIGNY